MMAPSIMESNTSSVSSSSQLNETLQPTVKEEFSSDNINIKSINNNNINSNDDDEEDEDEEEEDEGGETFSEGNKRKRKKRPPGNFKCDFDGCEKVFSRAEHLARHKLNHNPTVIYNCPWENCFKSFVRKDLLERHVKRHEVRKLKDEAKMKAILNGEEKKQSTRKRKKTEANQAEEKQKKIPINSLDSIILPNVEDQSSVDIHNYGNDAHLSAARDELNALRQGTIDQDEGTTLLTEKVHRPSLADNNHHQENLGQHPIHNSSTNPENINNAASPSNLISWLFDENQQDIGNLDTVPDFSGGNFFNPNDDPFGLSSNLLDDILQIPPNFPNPAHQTLVTPEIRQKLINLVPHIANHEYIHHLEQFLDLYWTCFHVQYPILHKPSFNTFTCHPILLLSMIMTGASYAKSEPNTIFKAKNPREFADLIAEPLRLIIFSCEEFHPPSRVYIIQSLLLLECYERFASSRKLHERAFLHHGTTIQLLRRSPGLGGNPLKNKTEYNRVNHNSTIWEKWIEFESIKRSALFAFYIDATHSMVFGYQLMLFSNHIQLNLPCDDDLWESYLTPKEIPNRNDSMPFLVGLRKILNREHVKTGIFGKKILLAGLLSIMFQLQQRDLQGSILEFEQLRDTWKDTLSLAFDYWNCDIMKGCCNSENAYLMKNQPLKSSRPYSLSKSDPRCKLPVYHMAQITLRIQHYDYYIFAGAPWRMNVHAEASDYELVGKKVREWANTSNGRVSVIYAYLFLFELFLTPQDCVEQLNLPYDSESDAVLNRLNVLALVTLLTWSYNFVLKGPESTHLAGSTKLVSTRNLFSIEDGYDYLRRIRGELTRLTGRMIHTKEPMDSISFHRTILQYASSLEVVENKHHITGLLGMISKKFEECYWEVGNEFSRLIENCRRRSFGSAKVRCDDMYRRSEI